MYIEKISIKCFGAVKDYVCDFGRGINIIEGPNESGKSTIGAFIKFVFFGLSTVSDGNSVSERKKYQNWESDSASGSIEFESDGKRYRIERTIIPALNGYGRETVKTVDLDSGEECLKDVDPGIYFFGVNGDVFAQSAYISQTIGAKVNGITVSRAIENMLFSGNELISIEEAGENLDKAKNELLFRNKKGGIIYELGIEKDKISKKIEDARADNAKYFALKKSLKALKTQESTVSEEISCREKEIAACEGRRTLAKFVTLEEKEQKLTELSKSLIEYKEAASNEGFIPDAGYVSKLSSLAGEAELYRNELEKAQNDRADLGFDKIDADDLEVLRKAREDGGPEAISEFFEDAHSKLRNSLMAGIFLTLFTLLWGALGCACIFLKELSEMVIGGFSIYYGGFIAAGVAAIMLILSVVFYVRSHSISKKCDKKLDYYGATTEDDIYVEINAASNRAKEQEIYVERLTAADENCKRIENEVMLRENEIKDMCLSWGKECQTLSSLTEIIDEAEKVISNISEKESAVKTEEAAFNVMKEALKDLSKEAACAAVEGVETELSPEMESAAIDRVKVLSEERQQLSVKIRESETDLARLEVSSVNISELLDSYDEVCCKIDSLTAYHDVLSLASSTLKKAGDDLRAGVSPRLSMQASEYIRKATSEKYGSISITSDLGIRYGTNSGGVSFASRESDYMSEGTKDLAYIGLRLALVGFLYKKDVPPLVFDEAFARLDDKRIEGALSIVSDYAESAGQVFLLTSQKREAEIMSNNENVRHIYLG